MTKDQRVLITGATGGIGLELAKLFASDGYQLVLVGRNSGRLQETAKVLLGRGATSVETHAIDLARAGAAEKVVDALKTPHVDILVNNAGYATNGKFNELDYESELGMVDLNIGTLTGLTKLLLPGMVERKQGWILNVASTAAFQPGPLMSVYYATKAYVLSFSLGIREEVRKDNVFVTALCPGPTKTGFATRAGMLRTRLFRENVMPAEKVAQLGYAALFSGKAFVVTGTLNKLAAFATRFVPRSLAAKLAMRAQS